MTRPADLDSVEHGPLVDLVGYALRRAHSALLSDFARATEGFDLSPGQYGSLVLIQSNPGITAVVLARAMNMDKSSLTPFLAKLEKRGLIERQRSDSDKRAFHIHLTEYGQRFLDDMTDLVRVQDARLARALGPEKVAALTALLAEAEALMTRPDLP